MSLIGARLPRIDSEAKVTGTLRYAADEAVPGLLHARLVLSSEAHALIDRIDVAEALSVPDVVRVLTAADLPVKENCDQRMFQPLADEEVSFIGQPVAMVVARTEQAAEDGLEGVITHYTPLEPVLDAEAAMVIGSPPVRQLRKRGENRAMSAHAGVGRAGRELPEEALSRNVYARHYYREGDIESAFESCQLIVGGRFQTSWIYQAYLEPQVATAWLEPDGELVVKSSTQAVFYTRDYLCRIFGLPLGSTTVIPTPLGGGFGAKWCLIEPLVAVLL